MTTHTAATQIRSGDGTLGIHQRLVRLARRSLRYQQQAEDFALAHRDTSRQLPALAVLALEGERDALDQFMAVLGNLASQRRAIDRPIVRNHLDDSFCLRSIVPAYHALVDADLVTAQDHHRICQWLYEVALRTSDGRAAAGPGFRQWHLRNQNVPATMVYVVANLLDQTLPGRFDTTALWAWGDSQIVGWDLTWRSPDDSWLYQFIWIWSAFLHARLRRPELLSSDHAFKSFAFYRHLNLPGSGEGMLFGDADPGDLLGAATALMLGANLFQNGEYLCLALRHLDEVERRGLHRNLADRGPEMFNLYRWWPRDLEPAASVGRSSMLMTSPLPGRGWAIGSPEYATRIKSTDKRFPFHGQNVDNWDAMYQVQAPDAYAQPRPDKMVLVDGDRKQSLFAVMDLRAHGLHDHADALNLVTLTADGCAWLVESAYLPRDLTGQRWMHNVPLMLAGLHEPATLRTWQSDTWREVEPGDCSMQLRDHRVYATARLRHDNFDYVDFATAQFDVQRTLIYTPDDSLVVVDQLTAVADGQATVGQIWHSPAALTRTGQAIVMQQQNRRLFMDTAQSHAGEFELTRRLPGDGDPDARYDSFYFRKGNPTQVLLWHYRGSLAAGQQIVMAARFGRAAASLSITGQGNAWALEVDGKQLLDAGSSILS